MSRGRSRKAPLAEKTSDLLRYRGLLSSSVLGAAAVFAVLLAGALDNHAGTESLVGPGPLGPGHRAAALECSDCHAADAPAESCAACHPGQASTRQGHRSLWQRHRLTCTSCHDGHEPLSVTFDPNGRVSLDGPAGVHAIGSDALYRPTTVTRVPLVRSSACLGCHDSARPDDPVQRCLPEPRALVQVCFDEHQPAASLTSRTAAWEAAGAVARSNAVLGLRRGPALALTPFLALALGLLVASLSFFGLRVLGRQRSTAIGAEPLAAGARGKVRLPQIDPDTCLGCYACVDACPFDVLEVERFVAKVARPDACCGLTLCEQKCPNGSLRMGEGERIDRRPELTAQLEVPGAPGLFLAGDLSGMSLIRNAINQGAAVAHRVADVLESERRPNDLADDVYDLVIVGAGPAGLSASLEAKRRRLRAVTLEQWDVAASIKSFPRHKLVLDAGVDADERASLWLEECSKEQLLSSWLLLAKKQRLPIRAGQRVTRVEPVPFGYRIEALDDQGCAVEYGTRRVLLAMGKRGTPRKLEVPVPEAWQSRVHYALLDARPFAEKRVLVVGLGGSAPSSSI